MAEAAEEKNNKMKDALGIKKDYKDGSSFNQELLAAQRATELQQKEEQKQKEMEMERKQK